MIIVEYRIPMPFSANEYRLGQLYTIAKKSRLESDSSAKNGVQINVNEPYCHGPGGFQGQYTNKTYHLTNIGIPECLRRLLPESAGKLCEEAWNAYPYSRNKFTSPLLDKLVLEIESRYLDGEPNLENVFNLEGRDETLRRIVLVDVVNDTYKGTRQHQSCGEQEMLALDPLYRRPLTKNWLQEYELELEQRKHIPPEEPTITGPDTSDLPCYELNKHLMTCYKLCRIHFPVWPLQNKVEQFILQYCRDTILETHRQTWLWQDEWTGMSLAEIRQMEKETQRHLQGLSYSN